MKNLRRVSIFSLAILFLLAPIFAFAQVNVLQGSANRIHFDQNGFLPLAGELWEIDQGQSVIANSANPNGWWINNNGLIPDPTLVTVPPVATPGTYTLKANYEGTQGQIYMGSETFNVLDATVSDRGVPPCWAEMEIPSMSVNSGGEGPSAYDKTELTSGVQVHEPPPDIVAYNAVGPSAPYKRMYRSSMAATNGLPLVLSSV